MIINNAFVTSDYDVIEQILKNIGNTSNCLDDYIIYNLCFNSLMSSKIKSNNKNIFISPKLLKSQVIEKSKFIFEGVDLQIPYISNINYYMCLLKGNQNEEKYINNINIFKVPLKYSLKGSAEVLYIANNDFYQIAVKNLQIRLWDNENCYIHEVCHPLIDRHKGLIKNALYSEFISIFTNLIYDYENYGYEYSKYVIYCQLIALKRSQNSLFSDQIETNTSKMTFERYFVSTLLSINLLDKYIHSNKKEKQEIIDNLKKVLNGEMILENFLELFDVSIYNKDTYNTFVKTLQKIKK